MQDEHKDMWNYTNKYMLALRTQPQKALKLLYNRNTYEMHTTIRTEYITKHHAHT